MVWGNTLSLMYQVFSLLIRSNSDLLSNLNDLLYHNIEVYQLTQKRSDFIYHT